MAATDSHRPMYARVLRLRHIDPGSAQCFLLFEAMVAFGFLLALAELVPWWGILALPAAVAAMVKMNDVLAGTIRQRGPLAAAPLAARGAPRRAVGRASVPGSLPLPGGAPSVPASGPLTRGGAVHGDDDPTPGDEHTTLGLVHSLNVLPVTEPVDSPRQRLRQSAARRYE